MNKIMKAGAGAAAVAAVAAGALLVSAQWGWGPDRATYTMQNPADHVTFNSITDNDMLNGYTMNGDERYFVEASPFTGNASDLYWSDETVVEDGKEYVVHMYVHNDAASNLNLVAENVHASVLLPTEAASSIEVAGMISSSNATPNEVWDSTTFKSADNREFTLKYSGGAKFTNCDEATRDPDSKACNNARTFDLNWDELKTENGAALGYNEMNGQIPGCIAYAGWVSFHVKAEFTSEPDYTIEKEAKIKGSDSDWAETVEGAKDGDVIAYRLHFTNTGNTPLYDVVLRDIFAKSEDAMDYDVNSVVLRTSDGTKTFSAEEAAGLFNENGLYIGDYAAGADAYVVFEATVKEGVDDECYTTEAENKVQASASTTDDGENRLETKEDIAVVRIEGKVCSEGYELDKMVRLENDTEWSETVKAKAGEKVYYRIRFHNTGDKDLENVIVSDDMPDHMTNISEVKYGLATADDADLKVGDGFFGDGLNLGTVKKGETYAVYFHATVDEALAGECEDKELENVVTGKYGDDDSTIKTDIATVEVDGQVCTEDTPGFTIDKMVQIEGSDKWSENVTIKANETVRYRIQFKNTGNVTLPNVVITDVIPEGINYDKEKGVIVYDKNNTEGKTVGDDLINGGLKLGDVEAGSTVTIYFYATADESFADDCETSKRTNVAKGKYNDDDSTSKEDTADVTITGMVCDVPEYPNTGAESNLGAIVATAMLAAAAAGYISSRKK